MQDLAQGKKKSCKFLKKMDKLCEQSFLTTGNKVVPCTLHPKKKTCMNSKKTEECDLQKVCAARLLQTGHSQDEDHGSEEGIDNADNEADDELEVTEAESELASKPRKKGFLHTHNSFVQKSSELEKGQCFEQEGTFEKE